MRQELPLPTLEAIRAATNRVYAHAQRTPLIPASSTSAVKALRLKCDFMQPGGAFKLRGAANAVMCLSDTQKQAGVVCASTGNHGRALALVSTALNVKCTICMSELVPQNKRRAIESLGANVCIVGRSQDEAQLRVDELVASEGMTEIPPFDHADVIAGQGTLGLELLEQWPELDTVVVPLSGGGLISGVALAVKALKPSVRVVAVSPQRGAAMAASLTAGQPVEVQEEPTLADSLGGGIGLQNRYTYRLVERYVDAVVLLDEEAIAGAMRHLFFTESLVTEGAGAAGMAVLLDDALRGRAGIADDASVAVVLSGRNVDMQAFLALMNEVCDE